MSEQAASEPEPPELSEAAEELVGPSGILGSDEYLVGTLGAEDFAAPGAAGAGWLGRTALRLSEAFLDWTNTSTTFPTYRLIPLAERLRDRARGAPVEHQAYRVMAARSRAENRANFPRTLDEMRVERQARRIINRWFRANKVYFPQVEGWTKEITDNGH